MGKKDFIEATLTPHVCSHNNGVWVCGANVAPEQILRRDASIARNKKNWSPWRLANFVYFEKILHDIPNSLLLLDLGAGPQHFKELTDRFNTCAVEYEAQPDIDVVCDLGKALPFLSHSYDIILLSNVLEHIEKPEQITTECFRILKPGGLLLGTVPFLMASHQRPYDFHRYTDIYLNTLFSQTGFTSVSVVALGNALHPLQSALHSYFKIVLEHTPKTHSRGNRLKRRGIAQLEILLLKLLKVVDRLFKKPVAEPEATEGYGFVVRKPLENTH
jgi:SAM-dependent methyltransferase